ncbi:MAG: hypothetical protein JSW27_07600, partial [Phycisphaerales bacterium]
VLLYELLTGRTPFEEKDLLQSGMDQMRKIIREQEPPKPSTKLATLQIEEQSTTALRHATDSPRLISLLRGDLDWIVMKCLEKDRMRRYDTANALASDVTRHLNDEPVMARPPTVAYQLQKAWRRNKVVYIAVASVAVALVLGTGISVWQARIANVARDKAVREEGQAKESEVEALRRAYNSDMSLAFHALEENLFGQVRDIVSRHVPAPGEPDFRGWEWRYAWAQSQSDAVHAWDTPDEMGEVAAVGISPDQRYVVSSDFHYGPMSYYRVRRLWDLATREELKHVRLPGGSARGFAFSNSGKYLALHRGETDLHGGTASGTSEIHIYDTGTWQLATRIPTGEWTPSLSFSPDDTALAAIVGSGAVLWDRRGEKIIREWPLEDGAWLSVVAFFQDGRRLAIGGSNGLKIVDVATGDIEHRRPARNGAITALAISPDSRCVAIGSKGGNGEISVLNTASWEPERPLTGHSRAVSSLTFSATGEWLMSSSDDSTIRVWDMGRRITTRVMKGHQSGVGSVSLTSDESRAISAGADKRILEWDLDARQGPSQEHVLAEPVEQVVFSADSRSFYTIDANGTVSIRDARTFSKRHPSSPELGKNGSLVLSPDGERLIIGTRTGRLWVLDAQDLHIVDRRDTHSRRILPVGFSADGRWLVALESGSRVSLWNGETWQCESSEETKRSIKFLGRNFPVYTSPPNSNILLYPSGADLVWWDLELAQEQASIRVNSKFPGIVAVSPTEPLLASADRGDFIVLWNWRTRRRVQRLRGPGAFHSVAFSPDGRRMISGSDGRGAIMLWDVSTRQEIARFGTSSADVTTVQFSPDGNTICAIDTVGTARFWRAPSFETIHAVAAKRAGGVAIDSPE